MRPSELEAKVLAIADRVGRNQPVEDGLLELKASWIEPKKAGRRLAGLCNAARGEPVLWIVGIDEDAGVVGVPAEELANWWPAVRAEFDQQEPSMMQNLSVPIGDRTIVALLFDSSRAPFVTKNPAGGGPVSLEVPWREGNSTRSARREDLLRILVPASKAPDVEVLRGDVVSFAPKPQDWRLKVVLELYVVARSEAVLVAHRTRVSFEPSQMSFANGGGTCEFSGNSVPGVSVTQDDVVLTRPAKLTLTAYGKMAGIGPYLPAQIQVRADIGVGDETALRPIIVPFVQTKTTEGRVEFSSVR